MRGALARLTALAVFGMTAWGGLCRADEGPLLRRLRSLPEGEWVAEVQRLLDDTPAEFERIGEVALGLARETGSATAEVDVLRAVGQAAVMAGDYARAGELADEALRYVARLDDPVRAAGCLVLLGTAHFHQGAYDDALVAYQEAARLCEGAGDPRCLLQSTNNIGNVFWSTGDLERALEYYQQAHDLAAELDDRLGLAGSALNLGLIHEDRGESQLAIGFFREALAGFEELGIAAGVAMAHHNIGGAMSLDGPSRDEALSHLERALGIRREIGDRRGITATLGALGEVYRVRGEVDRARRFIEEGIAEAEAIGEKQALVQHYDAMSQVERQLGSYRQALDWVERRAALQAELVNQESAARIAELEVRYRTEAKEREIELLKRDQALSAIALERQRGLRNWILVVSGLLLLLALALLGGYRFKVRVNRELEELSRTDALTGLHNRRAMLERLASEKSRSDRSGRPFVVALADLDDFKAVNDTHGHEAGDRALVQVAYTLRGQLRGQDAVGRWGGEEFLLLLPETDLDGGLAAADKIRRAVAAQPARSDGRLLSLTVSIGLVEYERGTELDRCLARADRALYRAKQEGKNRVRSAGGGDGA